MVRFLTPKDLGVVVREARVAAGLTQAALADKIGASRFWVAEFERGKPRAEVGLALKALRALKLTITIQSKEEATQSESLVTFNPYGHSSTITGSVDLSSILNRLPSAAPLDWEPSTTQTALARAWTDPAPTSSRRQNPRPKRKSAKGKRKS